jgi:hypothetical protein
MVVMVRYADDFVLGFQYRSDAEAMLAALKQRLGIVGCQFATREAALEVVCGRYGGIRGLRLYGPLCAYQGRLKGRVAYETGPRCHTILRLLREARKAGVAPAMVDGDPLPPLEIRWPPSPEQVPEGHWPAAEEATY